MSKATEKAASRYRKTKDGTVIVDVTARTPGDLYHRLDRTVPYAVRDLDPLLVEFLHDGAVEIGDQPFLIRFVLDEEPDDATKDRIRESVRVYFDHAQEQEKREQRKLIRKSITLLVGGLVFLAVAVFARQPSEEELSPILQFVVQGLMVTAWMSAWEGMSTFILEWPPIRKEAKLYERIAAAVVEFGTPQDHRSLKRDKSHGAVPALG